MGIWDCYYDAPNVNAEGNRASLCRMGCVFEIRTPRIECWRSFEVMM
jgi:hypothetical protein